MALEFNKLGIDYSVYLVTDSEHNHHSRTLLETIQNAICDGSVKIVQLREKRVGISSEEFVKFARQVHEITKQNRIPLIINDRIDIALEIDAEGVHVGQSDTPAKDARRLIGPNKILGVSVESIQEAKQAIEDGADYIGIQTCFPTSVQKAHPAPIQGHLGVRAILESIPAHLPVHTVTIGGINESNTARIVSKSAGRNERCLDGVAVITGIVGAQDAGEAAARIRREYEIGLREAREMNYKTLPAAGYHLQVLQRIPNFLRTLRTKCPLVHHITNYVTINDLANGTLAIGASPIMAPAQNESGDLARVVSAVVLNIGTLEESILDTMLEAGKHANLNKKPVVLDPVGVGATDFRRNATRRILSQVHVDIIKGNGAEIATVAAIVGCVGTESISEEAEVQARGVDSTGAGFINPCKIVQEIARREHNVVVMTGEKDYISDGRCTIAISNGHPFQSRITGSGCMLGAVIGAFAGICERDIFTAAVSGVVCANLAAEHAAQRTDVHGPGTFRSAFIDELANLNPDEILAEIKASALQHLQVES